jgi:Fur family transcriptional regulator, iron response regulator
MTRAPLHTLPQSPRSNGEVYLWPATPDSTTRLKDRLRDAGLIPTKTRIALYNLLFARGHRHVTAEMLFEEAAQSDVSVSLATVYNTLHQFTEVGLLRPIIVDGTKSHYDTKTSDHQHFYLEDLCRLIDLPHDVSVKNLPLPPKGYVIDRIDVVVRLRPSEAGTKL